jgi:hypothetical protein
LRNQETQDLKKRIPKGSRLAGISIFTEIELNAGSTDMRRAISPFSPGPTIGKKEIAE